MCTGRFRAPIAKESTPVSAGNARQYMDKSKPLPDVPWLEDYPNKEPGLGDFESWKVKQKKDEIVDPYAVWLYELSQHPEWDVGNYGRAPFSSSFLASSSSLSTRSM